MVRHYTNLSRRNFGIDTGFYPLGSCTMKHNPRVNEVIAQMPGICDVHPHQPEHHLQGLAIFHEMQHMLAVCAGMDEVTLQPVAGAQGEFTAVRCIQEYFRERGEAQRTRIVVPDSAHGTNPASAAMAGFEIVEVPSTEDGRIDLQALEAVLDDTIAAMMITNPNTLGLFETDIAAAQNSCTASAARCTTTERTSTPSSAGRRSVSWASTRSTTTSTRPSASPTAVADLALVPSASGAPRALLAGPGCGRSRRRSRRAHRRGRSLVPLARA